jgi:hypothetical protein
MLPVPPATLANILGKSGWIRVRPPNCPVPLRGMEGAVLGVATVVGVRCWSDRYAYVVLSGTSVWPKLVKHGHVQLPVNESRAAQLATFRSDVLALLTKHEVTKAVFKTAEKISKNSDTARAEVEGVLQEACFSHEPSVEVKSQVKSQIKKALDFDGKAGEVFTLFQKRDKLFDGLGKTKFDEAAITALAGLA